MDEQTFDYSTMTDEYHMSESGEINCMYSKHSITYRTQNKAGLPREANLSSIATANKEVDCSSCTLDYAGKSGDNHFVIYDDYESDLYNNGHKMNTNDNGSFVVSGNFNDNNKHNDTSDSSSSLKVGDIKKLLEENKQNVVWADHSTISNKSNNTYKYGVIEQNMHHINANRNISSQDSEYMESYARNRSLSYTYSSTSSLYTTDTSLYTWQYSDTSSKLDTARGEAACRLCDTISSSQKIKEKNTVFANEKATDIKLATCSKKSNNSINNNATSASSCASKYKDIDVNSNCFQNGTLDGDHYKNSDILVNRAVRHRETDLSPNTLIQKVYAGEMSEEQFDGRPEDCSSDVKGNLPPLVSSLQTREYILPENMTKVKCGFVEKERNTDANKKAGKNENNKAERNNRQQQQIPTMEIDDILQIFSKEGKNKKEKTLDEKLLYKKRLKRNCAIGISVVIVILIIIVVVISLIRAKVSFLTPVIKGIVKDQEPDGKEKDIFDGWIKPGFYSFSSPTIENLEKEHFDCYITHNINGGEQITGFPLALDNGSGKYKLGFIIHCYMFKHFWLIHSKKANYYIYLDGEPPFIKTLNNAPAVYKYPDTIAVKPNTTVTYIDNHSGVYLTCFTETECKPSSQQHKYEVIGTYKTSAVDNVGNSTALFTILVTNDIPTVSVSTLDENGNIIAEIVMNDPDMTYYFKSDTIIEAKSMVAGITSLSILEKNTLVVRKDCSPTELEDLSSPAKCSFTAEGSFLFIVSDRLGTKAKYQATLSNEKPKVTIVYKGAEKVISNYIEWVFVGSKVCINRYKYIIPTDYITMSYQPISQGGDDLMDDRINEGKNETPMPIKVVDGCSENTISLTAPFYFSDKTEEYIMEENNPFMAFIFCLLLDAEGIYLVSVRNSANTSSDYKLYVYNPDSY